MAPFLMSETKTPRQEHLECIEAYATSKTTDDKLLQRLATVHLATYLKKVDIVSPVQVPPAIAKQVAELPEVKKPEAAKPAPKKPTARKPRAKKETK